MAAAEGLDVLSGGVSAFALDVQIVLAARTGGVGEVIGWRQSPLAALVHQIAVLAGVVVSVAGQNIEDHAPEGGLHVIGVAGDGQGRAEEEVVARRLAPGRFHRAAQRHHVQTPTGFWPVKAPGGEIAWA